MAEITLKEVQLQNGETIGYREREGGSQTVVLVHGNMTSSAHWDLVLENMDERYKVYAIDLRGFGASSYHRPIHSIKDFSDDVKGFADALGLSGFALVGWSLGGAVCQQFCIDYPNRCSKLVLVASASTRGYPFFGSNDQGLPDPEKRLKTLDEVKRDHGKTLPVQGAYDQKNHELLRAIWDALIYTSEKPEPERYEKYLDDMCTQRNLADVYQALNIFNISRHDNGLTKGNGEVDTIDIPVLALRGDRDLVVTERMTKELVEDFEGRVKFIEMKDCGHSPLIDDLDGLLRHMEQFLEREEQKA
ncbi:alpha/beta hydrolase [Rossellomorea vietnamensis]|uniref:Alpha/beta hydrolase n=1 Tax=Rossellomorea vietnamensis TaxID=218284 RepID=A0A5D4ME58_9BACI|nr:alpha/beta hydrolase [Rossellomorea vietnamensis]TYR99737.1 alpha/beta hydrolase [Rossellomorea vietnamensis]